jgi:hypothetical protein
MAILLAGCATVRSEAPVVRLTCPPLVSYDKDFQKKAGEELSKLPPGSATQEVMMPEVAPIRQTTPAAGLSLALLLSSRQVSVVAVFRMFVDNRTAPA